MNTSFRLLVLSATVLGVSMAAQAQTTEKPAQTRDTITITKEGYATSSTPVSAGSQIYTEKEKIVREAYRKREIKKQKDVDALPPASTPVATPTNGPLF